MLVIPKKLRDLASQISTGRLNMPLKYVIINAKYGIF